MLPNRLPFQDTGGSSDRRSVLNLESGTRAFSGRSFGVWGVLKGRHQFRIVLSCGIRMRRPFQRLEFNARLVHLLHGNSERWALLALYYRNCVLLTNAPQKWYNGVFNIIRIDFNAE